MPTLHLGGLAHGHAELPQQRRVQSLFLHVDRHFVDTRQVLALHHALQIDIAEGGHLLADTVRKVLFGAQYEHVGLDASSLHLLHGVLGGFGLEFVSSPQIGHVGEMHAHGTIAQLPFQLADGFQKRRRLDVADGAPDLRNHKVNVVVTQHPALDFVGDVRHHLDGLAQIVSAALFVDDGLVDSTGGHGVGTGGADAREPFVMTQVQVGFHPIDSHVAFAVFVGVQRAGVDVDVGIEFLDGDGISPRLQQFSDAGRDDAFA